MNLALIRIGQRLIKYDDFETAYLIRKEEHNNQDWMVEVIGNKGKTFPVFFGTYNECIISLENVSIILADDYQEINPTMEE